MRERLQNEMADVQAAIMFVSRKHGFVFTNMMNRVRTKLALYEQWDSEE